LAFCANVLRVGLVVSPADRGDAVIDGPRVAERRG
jgi:hypothetical protein